MAGGSDSSDSDTIGPLKIHSSAGKRLASSSEEEASYHPCNRTPTSARKSENEDGAGDRRHSLRKRQRKFRLPSREEQWSSISTDSKVTNKLSHLTPRKAINDFTRITHRYNHDYVEVSGEESMEEFIKATDSSESSSDSSTTAKPDTSKKKGHRVQGYRPRIAKQCDESSEDDDPQLPDHQTDKKTQLRKLPPTITSNQQQNYQQSEAQNYKRQTRSTTQNRGLRSKEYKAQCVGKENSGSSDEEIQPGSVKKSRRKLILESENEESGQDSSSDEPVKPKADRKSKKPSVLDSDSGEDTEPSVLPNDKDSQDVIDSSTKSRKKSARLSDSESEEKEPLNKKSSTEKRASASCEQDDADGSQKVPVKNSCGGKTSGKGSVHKVSSGDSAITVDSSTCEDDNGSSTSDDGSGTDDESNDEGECVGRIQKLAARRNRRRDSMFDQLKSARTKKQKKTGV